MAVTTAHVFVMEARRNSQEKGWNEIDRGDGSFAYDVRRLNTQLGWSKYRQRVLPIPVPPADDTDDNDREATP